MSSKEQFRDALKRASGANTKLVEDNIRLKEKMQQLHQELKHANFKIEKLEEYEKKLIETLFKTKRWYQVFIKWPF
jgi:dynactin complex subunit